MPYGSCRSARQTVVEASRERNTIERNISGAGKIVGAFLGGEAIEQVTEGVPEA